MPGNSELLFKQVENESLYNASFPKNLKPTDIAKLNGSRMAVGNSLFTGNHTGNRLIATLNLLVGIVPKSIGWFIACEVGYLNLQIVAPELSEKEARALAREEGNKLAQEHIPFLKKIAEKNISCAISRWYDYDQKGENLSNKHTLLYKESIAQIYFLYLIGSFGNQISEDFFKQAVIDFNLYLKINSTITTSEFVKKLYQNSEQVSFAKELASLKAFTQKDFSLNEIFSTGTPISEIIHAAKDLYNTINSIAASRTDGFQKNNDPSINTLLKVLNKTALSKAADNVSFIRANCRDYALLDVVMILTLAKTQEFDYLFYPLRQTKTYRNFFNIIRKLCENLGLKIIDIILEEQKSLKNEPINQIQQLPLPNKISTADAAGTFGIFPKSPTISTNAQSLINDTLNDLEREAKVVQMMSENLRRNIQRTALLFTHFTQQDPALANDRELAKRIELVCEQVNTLPTLTYQQ